ncbi:hypothetical protein GGS23DRAFT_608231 [Durotheca rogersii]|uniref:uncharacterized protein n=1 Tax=Durotheca rogersii TaxID=419775 RepID=UPI00221E5443|nr:uncharacterized protein GGS23DRAFT_608231 [Durotheca rogersii]KAI5855045.1 hypothetical protein GGS23DRAFT_608231 [Durotheca rogersii]
MDQNRNRPIQDEENSLARPQIFVQLAFGVSWSRRHSPQTHTLTYVSRNLKNTRDSGNFPRQVPPPGTNFLAIPQSSSHRHREHSDRNHQQRQRQHSRHYDHRLEQPYALDHPRERDRPHDQTLDQSSEQFRSRPRQGSRGETRRLLPERGRSAPPPFNDSPWDVHPASGSVLFPCQVHTGGDNSQSLKALPAPPSLYRLGEDGLPWSAWAWPTDLRDDGEDETNSVDNPTATTAPFAVRVQEDPARVRELESLSTALMTVDNGFENQWWYQGPRESVATWCPRETEDIDDARTISTAEALLPDSGPPSSTLGPGDEQLSSLHALVSPISDTSTPTQSFQPLYRSLTTRSEELWMGS